MDRFTKLTRDLDAEMYKQIDIIYGSAAMAFHREWGFGTRKIGDIFHTTEEVWDECSKDNTVSMLQMLQEETGINIKATPNGKSWYELAFLNANLKVGTKTTMTDMQWLAMRQKQLEWVAPQIMACLFLSLHRKYGWGAERLGRLLNAICTIRSDYRFKRKAIVDACREETGIKLVGLFNRDRSA